MFLFLSCTLLYSLQPMCMGYPSKSVMYNLLDSSHFISGVDLQVYSNSFYFKSFWCRLSSLAPHENNLRNLDCFFKKVSKVALEDNLQSLHCLSILFHAIQVKVIHPTFRRMTHLSHDSAQVKKYHTYFPSFISDNKKLFIFQIYIKNVFQFWKSNFQEP